MSEHEHTQYPPKPEWQAESNVKNNRWLFHLILFGLLFYYFFDQDLVYVAALLLVLLIHELGHYVMMKVFGYKGVRIYVIPLLGGLTTGEKTQYSKREWLAVIAAGPLPGIIIGLLVFLINIPLQLPNLKTLWTTFLAINVLNSLPIYPLDGGRIMELLWFREDSLYRFIFGIVSVLSLTVLILVLSSPIMLIIPFSMVLNLVQEWKRYKIRQVLRQEQISYVGDFTEISDQQYWTLRDVVLMNNVGKFPDAEAGQYRYSILEPILIQEVRNLLVFKYVGTFYLAERILYMLLYLAMLLIPIGVVFLKT
jgi:stage IV sporulation protein FB